MASLALDWTWGFNRTILGGVASLVQDDNRHAIFYSAGQTGVIYQYGGVFREQRLLQGHCNPITCSVVSPDKKVIVTGDAGDDSLLVVWDAETGTPARTFYAPHPEGVAAVDVSSDSAVVATLAAGTTSTSQQQQLSVWEWRRTSDTPVATAVVPSKNSMTSVRFNPSDAKEMVVTNATKVLFWTWHEEEEEGGVLASYSPQLSRRHFRQPFGKFRVSAFLPATTQAATATDDGTVVVWDSPSDDDHDHDKKKVAVKALQLCDRAINQITTVGSYLAIAGDDGAVRVFDFTFRLEAFYEDIDAGEITSLSFARTTTNSGRELPDMIVGTRNACIVSLEARCFERARAEDRRGTIVVQGTAGETHGIAVHPSAPVLVIASHSGGIYLWDYDLKVLKLARMFEEDAEKGLFEKPHRVAFDPTGACLAAGFAGGLVKFLDSSTLEDATHDFRPTKADIVLLTFSQDGEWLAAADAAHATHLWFLKKRDAIRTTNQPPSSVEPHDDDDLRWTYVGRCWSHSGRVTGLEFGYVADTGLALASVGEDKNLVEYDVSATSVQAGIQVKGAYHIEETAVATACAWHPMLRGDFEERVITANSDFKLKQWNAENKICRRTSLGPTFGGPINGLVSIPRHEDASSTRGTSSSSDVLAYSTKSRVLGLLKLPLDGNPNKMMGVVGHPGEISAIQATPCGRFVVTAGGSDPTVNMWRVDLAALDAAEAEAEAGKLDPFLGLLDGDHVYEDLVDFFYYLQLRRQGEDATDQRKCDGTIHIADVPVIMRAVGFYPSETDIANMVAEIRYSEFATTGEIVDRVRMDDVLKLYVNHKPTRPIDLAQIQDALAVARAHIPPRADGAENPSTTTRDDRGSFSTEDPKTTTMNWEGLQNLLKAHGDKMSQDELDMCTAALKGHPLPADTALSQDDIIHDVLGFDEVSVLDDDDDDENTTHQQRPAALTSS
ncbi:hypothetical protein CTAYLR_005116 [Chrysophaeum taylorii]|uniref:Cilia- and flagella-associated protein 251 n=1 Tax=Chrysophaeum taylorii TaxID=2483200 RepID=A0AAD7UG74_9STRA|nr:hypothetical protein CTAYLR_005116 [Chrysophaeum taylorii]